MFDLTDDVENSPDNTQKVKPAEVKIDYSIPDKKDEKLKDEVPPPKKPEWIDKNDDEYNEYEYSDDKDGDDTKW